MNESYMILIATEDGREVKIIMDEQRRFHIPVGSWTIKETVLLESHQTVVGDEP